MRIISIFIGFWIIFLSLSIVLFKLKKRSVEWIRIFSQFIVQSSTVLFFLLPSFSLNFFIALISGIGTIEFIKILKNRYAVKQHLILEAYILLSTSLFPILHGYFKIETRSYSITVFILLFLLMLLFKEGEFALHRISALLFCLIINLMLSTLIDIRLSENGIYWCFFLYALVVLTDIGAYVIGQIIPGKIFIAPKISPKKHLEGIIACWVFIMGLSLLLKIVLFPKTSSFLILIGALGISIFSQIGDLAFSMIKRNFHIKDFGLSFPGIGGAWDVFDSLIFASPFFYFLLVHH